MKGIFLISMLVFITCQTEKRNPQIDIPICAYNDAFRDTLMASRIIENFNAKEWDNQNLIYDACWCANRFKLYKDQLRLSNFIMPLDSNIAESRATLKLEAYRGLRNLDSAMYYAELVQSYDLDTSLCLTYKVEMNFELGNWAESLEYCKLAIGLNEKITLIDSIEFKRYVVHNLIKLKRFEEACEYAATDVPEYFEIMKDSICNDELRVSWLKMK
jgi:hypothetical protein